MIHLYHSLLRTALYILFLISIISRRKSRITSRHSRLRIWILAIHIPSFCTACYRAGRTGDRFMSLCKSKQISNCCHPNALMTLMEYLQDYASPETKKVGLELIQKELENIPGEKIRKLTEEHLVDIENGQRDFRF